MSTRSPDPAQDPDELLSVVDEDDKVLRNATRAEVHKHDLMHRAAHVLVFNGIGELLLPLRSANKDRHPGTWDSSAASHVEAGEDYLRAARRELTEELGVQVDVEEVARIDACEQTGQEFVVVYRAESEGPFSFNRAEIDRLEFVSTAQIRKEIADGARTFTPSFPLVFEAAMKAANSQESGE